MLNQTITAGRLLAAVAITALVGCSGNATVTRSGSLPGGQGGQDGQGAHGTPSDSGAGGSGVGPILHLDGSVIGIGAGPSTKMDGGAQSGNTCAAAHAGVEPVPLDIALLVDTSYSMDFDLRWQYVKEGLLSFVSAPGQGALGLSLQFFPLRDQCDVAAYGTPALPMSNVADSEPDVERTLNARRMFGGTPIVQALQGVGRYASEWAKAHTDHRTVIVVATDGVPDDTCTASSLTPPNDLTHATEIARQLSTGTPPLPVFVIGVGDELDALNGIADAGGTGSAVLIANGAMAEEKLVDALRAIRKKSLGCEYVVPSDAQSRVDWNTVNVDFTSGGATTSFYYAGDRGSCSLKPESAWYYDDPKSPTKIVLCPDTCAAVANARTARIDIAYGCKQREVR